MSIQETFFASMFISIVASSVIIFLNALERVVRKLTFIGIIYLIISNMTVCTVFCSVYDYLYGSNEFLSIPAIVISVVNFITSVMIYTYDDLIKPSKNIKFLE